MDGRSVCLRAAPCLGVGLALRPAIAHHLPIEIEGQCSMANALALRCYSIRSLTPGLHPTLLPISGSRRNKPGRSLTAAQERCPRLRRARLKHRDPPPSDIIALQCYNVMVAILPTLRGINGHTYKSRHETGKSLLRKTKKWKIMHH